MRPTEEAVEAEKEAVEVFANLEVVEIVAYNVQQTVGVHMEAVGVSLQLYRGVLDFENQF